MLKVKVKLGGETTGSHHISPSKPSSKKRPEPEDSSAEDEPEEEEEIDQKQKRAKQPTKKKKAKTEEPKKSAKNSKKEAPKKKESKKKDPAPKKSAPTKKKAQPKGKKRAVESDEEFGGDEEPVASGSEPENDEEDIEDIEGVDEEMSEALPSDSEDVVSEDDEIEDGQGGLTSRQKSMRTDGTSKRFDEFLSLPEDFGKRKTKPLTDEQIAQRAVAAQKQKEQKVKSTEREKRAVLDKLINRQMSKKDKKALKEEQATQSEGKRAETTARTTLKGPMISYRTSNKGSVLLFPDSVPSDLRQTTSKYPPAKLNCKICNAKAFTYRDSKTGTPLCSLQCYQRLHKPQ
eukprot:TRINITY_DN6541_c0_g1_i1.p1 TRINITY_DN6541_c0_g1~~TRINITY_DN6541_c0_g1_i1.p1  ORF type:complete len:346 (-),score=95.99 TRINITY_DN6541_c0_g1_i1:57-1094(-)